MSGEGHAALHSGHQEYDRKENVLYRDRDEKKSDAARHTDELSDGLTQFHDAGCTRVENSLPQ